MRARDLGITIGTGTPGPHNAITDVEGVSVGHCTLIEGEGALVRGEGPVRTGVTLINPVSDDIWSQPVFAGYHRFNGHGEVTGLEWMRESGTLTSPIALTNTHSVGIVHETVLKLKIESLDQSQRFAGLPVIAETNDSGLSDTNGFHVREEHVRAAYDALSTGPVAEGNVGGGTGMICHAFKGGIGTSSRAVSTASGTFTVGVLVQSNHGARNRLTVNGAPVGEEIPDLLAEVPDLVVADSDEFGGDADQGAGSIIVIVATDAPLLTIQCERLAQRAGLGIARTGGAGEHSSGDFIVAFATGNRPHSAINDPGARDQLVPLSALPESSINPLYWAVIEATEEAIVNSMVAAETMVGRDGVKVHAIPHDRLVAALDKYSRRG